MTPKKRFLLLIAVALGLYVASTGVSYAVFRNIRGSSTDLILPINLGLAEKSFTRTGEPRTESCPLNGRLQTKKEKEAWEKRRPLGVMIENHTDARPQLGLNLADVVYEAVAEGGITRFLAVYYCEGGTEEIVIGPVRSARTFFLDWISEYGENPLYAHVGGANCDSSTGSGCQNGAKADALGQIVKYGWADYNDLNQFNIGYPTFWRDYSRGVATEHTMFADLQKLWDVAKKRGLTEKDEEGMKWNDGFHPWKFLKENEAKPGDVLQKVSFGFWDGYKDFDMIWTYDPAKNIYLRSMGGVPHEDALTKQQIEASVVILQFQTEAPANDGYPGNVHLLYGTIGTGPAKIFQGGKVVEGTWEKENREARTVFMDDDGNEIKFYPGKIWVETLPLGNAVTIE